MKYGFFDDKKREYVITDPATPFPWINYLGNDCLFSLISNTSGGYTFYKDAKLRRLTRYRYNNVPVDQGGKYFYVHEDGDFWSPTWQPVRKELDNYECRHGLGYTKIKGEKDGLEFSTLYFIPLDCLSEIHHMKITNNSDRKRTFKLFSFVEWCLWNALDDMTNFQRNFSTGEVEIKDSTIYHKTGYRERRNHYAFYSVNRGISGFDTDRESFLGLYNGFHNPGVVQKGQATNSVAHGWSPVASHCIDIELQPGESTTLIFNLGYVENEENQKWEARGIIDKVRAEEMISAYQSDNQVEMAFNELKKYWDEKLGIYQLDSPDEKLNRMVNTWNPYQCMVTYNLSRSASYFESGIGRGMGFRDSNQDLIGFVHMQPGKAKQRILDIAATQLEDGGAYHQYQPLTKRGNDEIGGNFNDDPLWLILSVSTYIKETGDWGILDEMVPFDNDETKATPLFDHLKRSFYHVVNNLGPHGLPLIGRADWNDCLNLNCFSTNPDESFQTTENKEGGKAESLMIAGMFVLYGNEFIELCKEHGKTGEIETAKKHVENMREAIEKDGWDGEWFLRAYDHAGHKIGSHVSAEGNIFIESQGFCVMAGIGLEDGKAKQALDSVKKHLDCDYGIVLHQPAYTKYHLNLGEISTYPQGYKENAGIFCHNNPWIMIAETMLGRGDQAFDYYKKITPAYLEEISDLHKVEPYVYCQMIAGKDAYKPGEGKNSWLSGTAAWNYYTISQYILGIRPEYNGLRVDPVIPANWEGFSLVRKFRGAEYEIKITNPDKVSKGVKKVVMDGTEITGNIIPVCQEGTRHKVEVVMG